MAKINNRHHHGVKRSIGEIIWREASASYGTLCGGSGSIGSSGVMASSAGVASSGMVFPQWRQHQKRMAWQNSASNSAAPPCLNIKRLARNIPYRAAAPRRLHLRERAAFCAL